MLLYAITMTARRARGEHVDIQFTTGIMLVASAEEIYEEGMKLAFRQFEEDAGWSEHRITVLEIPNGSDVGSLRLFWHTESLPAEGA